MRTTHRIEAAAAATALLSAIAISASASTPGADSSSAEECRATLLVERL